MPSASAKLEKQTSTEAFDPMKQVLTIVEKKVRNLEKRKGKLDSYRHDSQNGKELNDDQKKAVEKYDQVVEVLEFAKELQKQFQTVTQDNAKAQKKAAKREQLERQQQELQRIKEIMVYQDLLNSMGGEEVRQDFLNGTNGAVKLSEEELNSLDELYKAICPERDVESDNTSDFDQQLTQAADHIQALLDSKNKEVFGTTYKALKETLQKINSCVYFNKSDIDAPNETESNASIPEEKESDNKHFVEPQFTHSESNLRNEAEESVLTQQSGLNASPVERPYYQIENTSLYTEQNHPIQEVLSVQGNLNFLQESQIEVESSHVDSQVPATLAGTSYPNVQFSTASQPIAAAAINSQHRTRRPSEETAAMPSHPSAPNMVLANSASVQQQQVGQSIPAPVPLQPTSQAIDFDPARPIPTQTYTNQSFSSAIHPMMAAAVSQNYVPVVTLPHAIPPPHVLTSNMVVQPLPPRSTVASSSMASNPNTLSMAAAQTPVSGLSAASALSQQANIYSLCLKMNQLNNENAQPACVPSSQYDHNEIQETYQSTNNSQAYMSRESFVDNSSYSSNLKRGLNSRGGARGGNTSRGTTNARGSRAGYRN